MISRIPALKIGHLEVKVPIIQGGMGVGISLSGLASAVANEGAIGVIATAGIGMLESDFGVNTNEANLRALRKEIKQAKEKSKGVVGVNIMMALSDFDKLCLTAAEAGADIIFVGAGLPLKDPTIIPLDKLKKSSTLVAPIVSSARATNIIFQAWARAYNYIPDAVVVEGPLAGGHLGYSRSELDDPNFQLDKILPEVVKVIQGFEQEFNKKVPVIAAGGIYTGQDILKYMKLGASGVQMGTRFVATEECDASEEFKQTYVHAKKEDIVIINSPVGMPGRAIRNNFIDAFNNGKKEPVSCPYQCLKPCDYTKVPYCIALALTNAKKGRFDFGFAFAGANAYLVDKITTVKELIQSLLLEYEVALG